MSDDDLKWLLVIHSFIFLCFNNNHNKLWRILKEIRIPDHLVCLLRNLYIGQKQHLELDIEQTGSKLGKDYVKAEYCHPTYLIYIQSTSCEMLVWMKHHLESRLLGKYQ